MTREDDFGWAVVETDGSVCDRYESADAANRDLWQYPDGCRVEYIGAAVSL